MNLQPTAERVVIVLDEEDKEEKVVIVLDGEDEEEKAVIVLDEEDKEVNGEGVTLSCTSLYHFDITYLSFDLP